MSNRKLSIGKSSRQDKEHELMNQETIFGIGNLACAAFSGMPASGSLTRSSLNVNSGAVSKRQYLHWYFGIDRVFLFGKFCVLLPVCSLAILVVFIGLSLVNGATLQPLSELQNQTRQLF